MPIRCLIPNEVESIIISLFLELFLFIVFIKIIKSVFKFPLVSRYKDFFPVKIDFIPLEIFLQLYFTYNFGKTAFSSFLEFCELWDTEMTNSQFVTFCEELKWTKALPTIFQGKSFWRLIVLWKRTFFLALITKPIYTAQTLSFLSA